MKVRFFLFPHGRNNKHGNTLFAVDSEGRWRCRKCRVEAVQKRRERTKEMAVEYKGGNVVFVAMIGILELWSFII